jgi:hypothetical protein
MNQHFFITRSSNGQPAGEVRLGHPDVYWNRIRSIYASSTLGRKIIGFRIPGWELGIEAFGAPLPETRHPRPPAPTAMFAPACEVYQANAFHTLSDTCDCLVYEAPH